MENIYAKAFSQEDRRSERRSLALVTAIRELGGAPIPILVRDISEVGFSGDCHAPYPVPSLVSVSLPPLGDVRARVRWVGDGKLGAEFLQRLTEEAIAAVVQAEGA